MDRIKVPVRWHEADALTLLRWMAESDRDQSDRGGTINHATEGAGDWNAKKIRLSKKEYSYRTMLEEICVQKDAYWWVEDDPWIGLMVGPKSSYEEHKKRPASTQSEGKGIEKTFIITTDRVSVSAHANLMEKTESGLLGILSEQKNVAAFPYSLHSILTFPSFEARIWVKPISSWPGDNSQTIEILKDGKQMAVKKVGGEPIMQEAWGAIYSPGRSSDKKYQYIYIRCRNRGIHSPTSIHTYRIDNDFTIHEDGVVLPKEELENAEEARIKRMKDLIKKRAKEQQPAP